MIILRFVITNVFGFHKIFFFFSGRRGLHCWVLDEPAKMLDTNDRNAIVDFFKNATDPKFPTFQIDHIISKVCVPFYEKELKVQFPFNIQSRENVLKYMWPRLDEDVTRSMKHGIKIPFIIHPDTGFKAIYIDESSRNPFFQSENIVKESVEKFRNKLKEFSPSY